MSAVAAAVHRVVTGDRAALIVKKERPDLGECAWAPFPKQEQLLACPDWEVLYGGAAGGGKGQPLDAPILTPHGFKPMGSMRVGTMVSNPDGSVANVIGVYPLGERQLWRFVFHDGTSCEVTDDHLWLAWKSRRSRKHRGERQQGQASARIWVTAEIIAAIAKGDRFNMPVSEPVALTDSSRYPRRPVDPYLIGVLLGDGSMSKAGVRLTSADPEIVARIKERTPQLKMLGPYPTKSKAKDYRIAQRDPTIKHLKKWGLLGTDSFSKFIPESYAAGTLDERWELLRGLMDTDGWADADGDTYYCTTSAKLRDDVAALARSLGALVTITTKRGVSQNGPGAIAHKLRIKLRDGRLAFALERKRAITGRHPQSMARRLVRVERSRTAEAQCIKVSNPNGLYITNDFIVTHNTDGLLVDAWCLQFGGPDNPHHRAVIFRKSYPELRDLIDRARELYPKLIPGIKYNKTERIFTAPSGAKLELAYCANDSDRFQYRGRAWNYIGFEELTLWATDVVYQYLKSRCRTTDRTLPRYIRSTSNPDGPGQKWVMEYFGIEESGNASVRVFKKTFEEVAEDGTIFYVKRNVRRRFIPARLVDNPALAGTGYRETLIDLPPDDREALLKGLWTGNRVRGAYYVKEMQRARAENRIKMIPHVRGVPVNTFWDVGWNDTTAIWFHQYVAGEHRFLLAYEESGETLDWWATFLQRMANERGYVYGTHYLPHDCENVRQQTGKTDKEVLEKAMPGAKFIVVPRVDKILNGINALRAVLNQCWFDMDDCSGGIAAMDAYRKKWDSKREIFTDEPEHDRYSNFADALRQFGQGYAIPRSRGGGTRRPSPTRTWKTA